MKTNIKNHALPALLGVALCATACQGTIDFDGPGRDPKMIVGAVIGPTLDAENDDRQFVHVTESIFLFGDRPYDSPRGEVEGAAFTIRRNGVEVEKDVELDKDGNPADTYYHIPTVTGDRLELTGTSLRHGSVSASDVVPAPADFRRLETEWFRGERGDWCLRTRVTVADPAGERNYYRFSARSLTKTKMTYTQWDGTENVFDQDYSLNHDVFVDSEIAFSNAVGDPAMGSMTWSAISDELFDGREYTFELYIKLDRRMDTGWGNSPDYVMEVLSQSVTLEVQTLSENLFKYRRSADIQSNEHNFSEPTRLYTNVKGGYGIFGTYNVASKSAELEVLKTDVR